MIGGIIIGMFVGAPLGMIVTTLCVISGKESRREEERERMSKRGKNK